MRIPKKIVLFCLGMVLFFSPFSKKYTLFFLRPAVIIWFLATIFLALRREKLNFPSIGKFFIFFFFTVFISLFFSTDFYYSQKLFFYRFSLFILFPFVCSFCIDRYNEVKFLTLFALLGATVVGIDALFQFFTGIDFINSYSVAKEVDGSSLSALLGPFGWYTQLGAYSAFVSVATLILILFLRKKVFQRILLVFLFLLMLFSLIFSLSRGAWASFFLSLLIVSFIISRNIQIKKNRRMQSKILYFYVTVLLMCFLIFKLNLRKTDVFNKETLLSGRDEIWREAVSLIKKYPLFGIGLYRAPFLISSGKDAHNTYLNLLLETGLLGFVPFILILTLYLKEMISFFLNIDLKKAAYLFVFFSICLGFLINDLKEATMLGGWDLGIFFWLSLGISLRGMELFERGYKNLNNDE